MAPKVSSTHYTVFPSLLGKVKTPVAHGMTICVVDLLKRVQIRHHKRADHIVAPRPVRHQVVFENPPIESTCQGILAAYFCNLCQETIPYLFQVVVLSDITENLHAADYFSRLIRYRCTRYRHGSDGTVPVGEKKQFPFDDSFLPYCVLRLLGWRHPGREAGVGGARAGVRGVPGARCSAVGNIQEGAQLMSSFGKMTLLALVRLEPGQKNGQEEGV